MAGYNALRTDSNVSLGWVPHAQTVWEEVSLYEEMTATPS